MSPKSLLHHLNQRSTRLFPRVPRYLKALIVIAFVSASIFAVKKIQAEDQPTSGADIYLQKQEAISQGNGQESWLDEAMGSNAVSLYSALNGNIPAQVIESYKSTGMIPRFTPTGAVGTLNKFIATTFTPAASGVEYIAQVRDNFFGIKEANAQGVGFKGLEFLLPLWRGFRNVTYVLTSIVFVVIGLMIILRVKISPQAVITIQSAIPGLITTLILITFSYAIAGLMIDVGNLLLGLVLAILFSVNGRSFTGSIFGTWWQNGSGLPGISSVGDLWNAATNTFSFKSLADPSLRTLQMLTYRALPGAVSSMMLGGLMGSIVTGFFLGGIGNFIGGAGSNFVLDMAGRALGGSVGGVVAFVILPLIFSIIACIWLIKLYFGLFTTYVTLIFKIILGPLEICLGAFPNSKIGFNTWFMDVVSNVAVFPIVTLFLVILNLVVDAVTGNGILSPAVWAPGLISANPVGAGGSISPSILGAAIGMAGLALLSKLPAMVPEFIFMIKPSPWGKAIGQGLGNMPVVGSASKTISGGLEKGGQEAVLAGVKSVAQRFGIGARTAQNTEADDLPLPQNRP